MTNLHSLPPVRKRTSRVGRGIAAGQGKTAGRGTKGQKARTGHNIPTGFEGGQSKLYMRLPKRRGEQNRPRDGKATVTLGALDRTFAEGERVSIQSLRKYGLVPVGTSKVTVVSSGTLSKSLKFAGVHFTASAHKIIYSS